MMINFEAKTFQSKLIIKKGKLCTSFRAYLQGPKRLMAQKSRVKREKERKRGKPKKKKEERFSGLIVQGKAKERGGQQERTDRKWRRMVFICYSVET